MGFSSALLKMKFLIVCLFAAAYAAPEADAEADPAIFYGGYGYPYAYGGYGLTYGLPAVHTVVKAAEADEDAAVAEVKTVAAPALTYAGYTGFPYAAAYHPYAYGVAGYPYAHAAYSYVPTVAATHVVAKRSADADADADAYYAHYGYARHYGYGYAHHGYYRPYGYAGYRGYYWG